MKDKDLRVVLFRSRNKDNKQTIPNFKERRYAFLSTKTKEELQEEFSRFVQRGLPEEMSRFYISVNARDSHRINKDLTHYLIDHEDTDLTKLSGKLASIASLKENAKEKKWLFDFDYSTVNHVIAFIEDIKVCASRDVGVMIHKTPNGYAVIVDQGFDTRNLLDIWEHAELKRDGMLCVDWKTKEMKE